MSAAVIEESTEFVSPVVPDRADQPVSETTERFLRAILERIPLENIEEVHMFSPLRQGTVETGIAVVASRVIEVPPPVVEESEPELELSEGEVVDAATEVVAGETPEAVEVAVPDVDAAAETTDAVADNAVDSASVEDAVAVADDANVVSAETTTDAETMSSIDAEVDVEMKSSIDAEVTDNRPPIERHTVYTARYRLVIKGPERGRWEADMVEEADAPLLTVETVVRGVQRRAGEDSEIVRFNARQIARALRITPAA